MLFARLLGIVLQPELHRAAEDGLGLQVAVGLGHNLPIDASRRMAGRGAMVFHRLAHHFDLLRRKPFAQTLVGSHNLASRDVVDGTRAVHPDVVVGGNGVSHIQVGSHTPGQHEATADHALHVADAMRASKLGITGQNVGLNEVNEVQTGGCFGHNP